MASTRKKAQIFRAEARSHRGRRGQRQQIKEGKCYKGKTCDEMSICPLIRASQSGPAGERALACR